MIMTARRNRKLVILGIAVLAPLVVGGAAHASDWPTHEGDPNDWGPPLAALCASPAAAAAAGYNVILGNNAANAITGTVLPDAIFSFGGNDTVEGGPRDDLLCLGLGDDKGNGNRGNDAVFGEEHNDKLRGSTERDYLDGGTQNDKCDGGPQADAATACEVVVNVP
jgi:Ca2+-binding RTX toxin-like protein